MQYWRIPMLKKWDPTTLIWGALFLTTTYWVGKLPPLTLLCLEKNIEGEGWAGEYQSNIFFFPFKIFLFCLQIISLYHQPWDWAARNSSLPASQGQPESAVKLCNKSEHQELRLQGRVTIYISLFMDLFCQEADFQLNRNKRKLKNSRFPNPRELFLNFRREKLLTDFWRSTKEEEDYLQRRSSDSDCKRSGSWWNNAAFLLGNGCGCFPGGWVRRKRMNVKNYKKNKADAHDFKDGLYVPITEL